MMKFLVLTLFFAVFGVRAVCAGQFLVQTKATVDPTVEMPDRILNECQPLESKLGEYTLKYVHKWLPDAQAVEASNVTEDAHVLELSIRGIVAPRGSGWTGRKAVAIRAIVVASGVPLTSTVIVSSGRGRLFDNTCGVLDDVVDDLAERAANWFAKGSKNNFVRIRKPLGQPLALLTPARFDSGAGVSDAVLRECALEVALANRTLASLNGPYPDTIPVMDAAQAGDRRLVTLTIMNIDARSGGSLLGPKTLGLRITVMQGGTEIAYHDIAHSGGGGIFGQMTVSACAVLERESAVLAQMITKWMVATDRAALLSQQTVVQSDGEAAADSEVASPE